MPVKNEEVFMSTSMSWWLFQRHGLLSKYLLVLLPQVVLKPKTGNYRCNSHCEKFPLDEPVIKELLFLIPENRAGILRYILWSSNIVKF